MSEEKYAFENGKLFIIDPELNLHYEETFTPLRITYKERTPEKRDDGISLEVLEGKKGNVLQAYWKKGDKLHGECQFFYPDGAIKLFSFYSEGQLHGPSTFLSEQGPLLASSWFVYGKQEGKAWQYYQNGELYSRQRFQHGLWHGLQEYYYPSGILKTVMPYDKGQLNGTVILYDAQGNVERELVFKHGTKFEET